MTRNRTCCTLHMPNLPGSHTVRKKAWCRVVHAGHVLGLGAQYKARMRWRQARANTGGTFQGIWSYRLAPGAAAVCSRPLKGSQPCQCRLYQRRQMPHRLCQWRCQRHPLRQCHWCRRQGARKWQWLGEAGAGEEGRARRRPQRRRRQRQTRHRSRPAHDDTESPSKYV